MPLVILLSLSEDETKEKVQEEPYLVLISQTTPIQTSLFHLFSNHFDSIFMSRLFIYLNTFISLKKYFSNQKLVKQFKGIQIYTKLYFVKRSVEILDREVKKLTRVTIIKFLTLQFPQMQSFLLQINDCTIICSYSYLFIFNNYIVSFLRISLKIS